MKVWAILHCEVWNVKPTYFVDEMLFHISSTFENAEKYVKKVHITSNSWWKVLEVDVDNLDFHKDAVATYYYGNKGKRLQKAPHTRATKAFMKYHPTGSRNENGVIV